MNHRVALQSASYDEDGALQGLADLGAAISDWAACRIVGGHMVSLHVAIARVDVEHRPTGDTDLAAPVTVLADPALGDALQQDLGYDKISGNRLERAAAAIVLKARAGRPKDAIDLDRLLGAAVHTGTTLPPPPHADKDLRLAVEYIHGPFVRAADEQRRLNVERVVPRPEPREFLNL